MMPKNSLETDLYDRIEALEAQNADLLAAAEALLDRLDTMTTEEFRHGGEREQRESLHAEVQKSIREKPKMTNAQNIVVIGSGHLLSILAENARLRAALAWYLEDDKRSVDDGTLENIRDRPAFAALQEQEAKP